MTSWLDGTGIATPYPTLNGGIAVYCACGAPVDLLLDERVSPGRVERLGVCRKCQRRVRVTVHLDIIDPAPATIAAAQVIVRFPSFRQLDQAMNALKEKLANHSFRYHAPKEVIDDHLATLVDLEHQLQVIAAADTPSHRREGAGLRDKGKDTVK